MTVWNDRAWTCASSGAVVIVADRGDYLSTDPMLLPSMRFNTASFDDEEEAQQAYLDRLDGVLETEFLQPFAATFVGYRLGPLSVLSLVASARRSTRSPERIAADRYGSFGIQYIVAGRASGNADGRPVVSEPGTVMLLDYARPFAITDHETRTVVNVAVPQTLVLGLRRSRDWHGAILTGPAAQLLAGFMAKLDHVLPALPASAGQPLAEAFVALLTSVVDASMPSVADAEEALIARAEALIDTWIASPDLGPGWLANRLTVSRSELYATLERFGGVSRFILQRRLEAARAALEDPEDDRQIRVIAFAFGFGSEAHFSRSFRASYGTTPRDVRRSARELRPVPALT